MSLPLRLAGRAAMCAALTGLAGGAIAQTTTVTFQNGLNGYNGTFDRRIADANQTTEEYNGSTVADFFVDGYAPDGTDTGTAPDSNDQQMLIRFDGMFGAGAGQIPAGATILDANPAAKGFRAIIDATLPDGQTAELRIYLRSRGRPLSETWTSTWSAPGAAGTAVKD